MSTLFSMPRVKSHSPRVAIFVPAVELVLRPGRFFRGLLRFRPHSTPFLLIWIVGVSAAFENLTNRILVMNTLGRAVPPMLTSWTTVWPIALVGGLVVGTVAWIIQGWWFRVRLRFSGAPSGESSHHAARLVWLYAASVWAIPALVGNLMATPLHADLQAAMNAGFFGLTELAMSSWASFVAYRGAVSCFPVRRRAALWWFLILPLAFIGSLVAGVMVASARGFGV